MSKESAQDMSDSPKVSLVVPTYNQADYLGPCLDSIMFQDYPNLEIVVVYEAEATDHTREVIEDFLASVPTQRVSYASNYNEATGEVERTEHHRYPQKGREIVVLRNERNRGATFAYNLGFQAATGEYCTYIASDDLCHPQMVSTLAAPLAADAADFVYSDMFVFDDRGRILREFKLPDYSFRACFGNWYLCGVSKLYRRALHERFGWYDDGFVANDHEFYLRLALGGARFLHVPKTLYSVRIHENREIGVHSPASWVRLLDESKSLVRRARAAMAKPA